METKSWTTVDKTGWGPGPWQDEPDKAQWTDEATGLPCLIKRNRFGALCGYVGIPEGHPWYRTGYGDIDLPDGVHGGLTFADHCQEDGDEAETICHIPAPGEPDNVWWAGFDCAHYTDLSPANEALLREVGFDHGHHPLTPEQIYRDLTYVQDQCRHLAHQIHDRRDSR